MHFTFPDLPISKDLNRPSRQPHLNVKSLKLESISLEVSKEEDEKIKLEKNKKKTKFYLIILKLVWSGRQDLNLRPLDPQSSALPGCATPR